MNKLNVKRIGEVSRVECRQCGEQIKGDPLLFGGPGSFACEPCVEKHYAKEYGPALDEFAEEILARKQQAQKWLRRNAW
jgi:hypothetical protein